MDGLYAEYVARSVARENIHHRGPIKVATFHNPFVGFNEFVNRVVNAFKGMLQTQEKEVDCLEFAPNC